MKYKYESVSCEEPHTEDTEIKINANNNIDLTILEKKYLQKIQF